MRCNSTLKQISLQQSVKLFVADVRLPKTSWKAVPQHTGDYSHRIRRKRRQIVDRLSPF